MGRKLLLSIVAAFAVIGIGFFGSSAQAKPRNLRGTTSINIHAPDNLEMVGVVVVIAELRGGKNAKGIVDGPAIRQIKRFESYRFREARRGRRYSVVVTDLQGKVLFDGKTRVIGDGWSIGLGRVSITATTPELQEANNTIYALQQQISLLQKALEARDTRITELEAQLIGPPPETFTAMVNPTLSDLRVAIGQEGARVASYLFYAPAGEGVSIHSQLLDKDDSPGLDLANIRAVVGGKTLGMVQGQLGDQDPAIFLSGSAPITVPDGQWVVVDIFADVLSTSQVGIYGSAMDLRDFFGVTLTSGDVLLGSGEVEGQDIIVTPPEESIKG